MPVFVRLAFQKGIIMTEKTEFNYVVARPWDPTKPEGALGTYMSGGREVFTGTMAEAEEFKAYCNARITEEERARNPYKIYKLVEVPEYK
jgi:hypothetical protein